MTYEYLCKLSITPGMVSIRRPCRGPAFSTYPWDAGLILEQLRSAESFWVAFRTPVRDNRGIPHILAHMLITPPSKRYPPSSGVAINDESLAGPMNAWTYPDWTIFYVETGHQADLYDRALAWLDRAFQPRFDRLTFQREGWHFTYRGGALGISGGVYNEVNYPRLEAWGLFPDATAIMFRLELPMVEVVGMYGWFTAALRPILTAAFVSAGAK
jgi:hypothetical protein